MTKLKSVFQNPLSSLLLKAIIFAGFLTLAKIGGFGLLPIATFVVAAIVLYLRPFFRTVKFFGSFLVFLASVIVFNLTFLDFFDFIFGVSYFSFTFWILIGVKDLILIQREVWGRLLSFLIIYPALLTFFYHNQAFHFWQPPVLFLAVWIPSSNLLNSRLFYWILPFLTIQLAWAAALLPIGFVGAANLVLLAYVSGILFIDEYLAGQLNRKKIFLLSTTFILLSTLILGVAKWGN